MPEAIEVELRVRARPETVFTYFTDPVKYRMWQGMDAELDPRPGGIFRVRTSERHAFRGEYVVVEPPRRLVFTWGSEGDVAPPGVRDVAVGSSTVEVTFTPDGRDTILRLRHDGLPNEMSVGLHRWGWDTYLPRLALVVSGSDPGPDPLPQMLAQLAAGDAPAG